LYSLNTDHRSKPDNILYLSYWYTGWELPARLSWFWVSYQSTQIVSAFFAFGILRLRGYNGMEGWVSPPKK
jgi:hypothetical protein